MGEPLGLPQVPVREHVPQRILFLSEVALDSCVGWVFWR